MGIILKRIEINRRSLRIHTFPPTDHNACDDRKESDPDHSTLKYMSSPRFVGVSFVALIGGLFKPEEAKSYADGQAVW